MKIQPPPTSLFQHPLAFRLKPHLPLISLALALLIIFLIRFFTVMTHLDMGQDIANYLTTMNTVFGQDATGVGLLRPPLIAIPIKLFTLIFGSLTGVKLFGVAVSVAIGLPFYALARRITSPWIAVSAAIIFVLTSPYSRMLAWGYITMTGIFFILLALHFLVLTLEKPTLRNAIITGLAISMVAGLHQLSFTFLVLMLLAFMLALLLFHRPALLAARKSLAVAALAAIMLCAPYIPVYLHLIDLQRGGGEGMSASVQPLATFVGYLAQPHYCIGILLGIALVIVALSLLWKQDRNRTLLLGALFFLCLALSLFALPGPFVELNRRAPLFLYIPIWLLLAVILSYLWQWRSQYTAGVLRYLPKAVTVIALVALIVSCSLTSHHELCSGLNFYGYLNEGRWDAIQWTKHNTPADAIVAAYPESLGWWIEGEARRTTFRVTDRNMTPYGFEAEHALQTERILSRNQGIENGRIRLAYCYPYTGVPGDPVLGAYVGGQYQDLLMFDDAATHVAFSDSSSRNLTYASKDLSILLGNSHAMEITASYSMAEAMVTQRSELERDVSHTVLAYNVYRQSQSVTRLDIPVFFCTGETSVIIHQADSSVEIVQQITTAFEGAVEVSTHLSLEVNGATLLTIEPAHDRLTVSFIVHSDHAAVTLDFSTTVPVQPAGSDVVYYEVQRVLEQYGVDFVAVDFTPGSPLWADLSPSTELWLDSCPYYELLHSESGVKIYKVSLSS